MEYFSALILSLLLIFAQGPAVPGRTGKVSSGTANQAHLARQFNGTSDFLQSSTTILSGTPTVITLSFWLYENAFDNGDELAFETSANFNLHQGGFIVNPNSSATTDFQFSVFTGVGAYLSCDFARPSAAAWHQYTLEMDVTSTNGACKAYVDGVNQSPNKNTGSVAITFTAQTLYVMSRAGLSLFNAGRMTSIGVWTADESGNASSLASCSTDITTVDAGNLVNYWPIVQASPETASVGTPTLTVTGTTNVAGPC